MAGNILQAEKVSLPKKLNFNDESNKSSSFQWGGSKISPARKTNNKSIFKSTCITSNKNKSHARVYKDVQNKGLVSRIIKYHDDSIRLNRSLSMSTLYNKPGQFPVVHLKKDIVPYKTNHNHNFSTTNISAPDNSFYNSYTNASRYGSVMNLQKSDEEISRENRPIMHPPPTDVEIAPTPSVLEVLKEISRKRINSDELLNTKSTKKCCNRESCPTQDSLLSTTVNSTEKSVNSNYGIVTCKRQREHRKSFSDQQCSPSSLNTSPDQLQAVKKRMFSYNNDITSSLSSSLLSKSKRKLSQVKSVDLNASDVADEGHSTKQKCANLSMDQSIRAVKYDSIPSKSVTSFSGLPQTIRTFSEPAISTKDKDKPKLTLFNKNYDETKIDEILPKKRDNLETSEINFVKPKKSSSISKASNVLAERTQKSKLALMLSGLKGELDEIDNIDNDKSEVDSLQTNNNITQTTSSEQIILPSVTTTTTTISIPNEQLTSFALTTNSISNGPLVGQALFNETSKTSEPNKTTTESLRNSPVVFSLATSSSTTTSTTDSTKGNVAVNTFPTEKSTIKSTTIADTMLNSTNKQMTPITFSTLPTSLNTSTALISNKKEGFQTAASLPVFGKKVGFESNSSFSTSTADKFLIPPTTKAFSFTNPMVSINSSEKITNPNETCKETLSFFGQTGGNKETIKSGQISTTHANDSSKEIIPVIQSVVNSQPNQFFFQPQIDKSSTMFASTPTLGGFKFDSKSGSSDSIPKNNTNVFLPTKSNFNVENKLPISKNDQSNATNNLFNLSAAPLSKLSTFSNASNDSIQKTNLFSTSTANQNVPPSNGFFGNNTTTSGASVFTFGKVNIESQKTTPTSSAKVITFGSPIVSQETCSTNLFGNTNGPSAAVHTPFQFNATTVVTPQDQALQARPIRRATRRLQKP